MVNWRDLPRKCKGSEVFAHAGTQLLTPAHPKQHGGPMVVRPPAHRTTAPRSPGFGFVPLRARCGGGSVHGRSRTHCQD
jgi:hypothetical protein